MSTLFYQLFHSVFNSENVLDKVTKSKELLVGMYVCQTPGRLTVKAFSQRHVVRADRIRGCWCPVQGVCISQEPEDQLKE